MSQTIHVKGCRVGIRRVGDRLHLKFPYNEAVVREVKLLPNPQWNRDAREWTVEASQATEFALAVMRGEDPFGPWDSDLPEYPGHRACLFTHQRQLVAQAIHRPGSILAASPGVGKSLVAAEAMEEMAPGGGVWLVAPKSALLSVKMDFEKWKYRGPDIQFLSMHDMKKAAKSGGNAPQVFVVDECHRVKTDQSDQAKAAAWIADAVREEWGDKGRVILMSGTPAPKSPVDWFWQCRIAAPGFLKECNKRAFLDRLAIVRKVQGESGICYPKIVGWKDDERKCAVCGWFIDHECHNTSLEALLTRNPNDPDAAHKFVPTLNEVALLHERMKGLVMVVKKEDVLKELPEKVYDRVVLQPDKRTLAIAKVIVKSSPTAAMARNLLRQLSSGFQYTSKPGPNKDCPSHSGEDCIHCAGRGYLRTTIDTAVSTNTPKDEALCEILEDQSEQGRIIVSASFTEAIDRIVGLCVKAGWEVICRDGRGWNTTMKREEPWADVDYVKAFQREDGVHRPKVAFVGHPKSAGVGLTLTASDLVVYWDNTDDLADRIQMGDRIHRPGSTGARYIDLIHLPVDGQILDKLYEKDGLQNMTLGDLQKAMEDV